MQSDEQNLTGLCVLEDEHVGLVVAFQELEIELDGLLPKQDSSQLVVYCFRFLAINERALRVSVHVDTHSFAFWKLLPYTLQVVLCATLDQVKGHLVGQEFILRHQ